MGPIDMREIINDMTYAISLNRHATRSHFKIDMEITKIVTRDMGISYIRHATLGTPRQGPHLSATSALRLGPLDQSLLTVTHFLKTQCHPLWGTPSMLGPLKGGRQCRMSNLRNGYVRCPYLKKFHVDFKIVECRMSNLRNGLCHVDSIFSHVDRLHVECRI